MTPQKEPGKEGLKILLMLASAIIITAGLQAGKQVLLPIVLSGFLAIVSYPITTFFKNKLRFPHWLAVLFTVIMDFGVLVGLGYLAQYLGQDLAKTINAKYYPLLFEKVHEFRAFLIERDWNNLADQMLQEIPDLLNSQRIVALSTGVMGQLASMLTFTTLILILMTFFLGEAPRFRANINKLGSNSDTGIRKFSKALEGVQKYLVIKTFISALTGLLAFLLCYYMGVDFPLLWGIVASRSTSFPRSAPSSPPFPPRCWPCCSSAPRRASLWREGTCSSIRPWATAWSPCCWDASSGSSPAWSFFPSSSGAGYGGPSACFWPFPSPCW